MRQIGIDAGFRGNPGRERYEDWLHRSCGIHKRGSAQAWSRDMPTVEAAEDKRERKAAKRRRDAERGLANRRVVM